MYRSSKLLPERMASTTTASTNRSWKQKYFLTREYLLIDIAIKAGNLFEYWSHKLKKMFCVFVWLGLTFDQLFGVKDFHDVIHCDHIPRTTVSLNVTWRKRGSKLTWRVSRSIWPSINDKRILNYWKSVKSDLSSINMTTFLQFVVCMTLLVSSASGQNSNWKTQKVKKKHQGSISPTFYEQLLRPKIPKAQ